jgi:hypothetical protein
MSGLVTEPDTKDKTEAGPVIRSGIALMAAGAAVFCLLSGLSYPGFPFTTASWGVLAALVSVVLVLSSGVRAVMNSRGYARAGVMLALVAVIFTGGVVAAKQDDGALLAARWANSRAAFEAEVAALGPVPPVKAGVGVGYTDAYPRACPSRLGDFPIDRCSSFDGGYLFHQAPAADTDHAGILYLPGPPKGPEEWVDETVAPLGGPWYSWVCYC